jgi:hypothetical protein
VEEKARVAIINGLHMGRMAKVKKSFHEPLKTMLRCPIRACACPCCLFTNCSLLDSCSIREGDVNKAPHNTATSLMAKIMEVMANLLRATVAKACKRFRPHIKAVVKAGGYFYK